MLVNPQGLIIASSGSASVGRSLFTDFANTRNEFAMADQARPGSSYVSLTNALKSTNYVTTEERRSNQLLGIQILVPVLFQLDRPSAEQRSTNEATLAVWSGFAAVWKDLSAIASLAMR